MSDDGRELQYIHRDEVDGVMYDEIKDIAER